MFQRLGIVVAAFARTRISSGFIRTLASAATKCALVVLMIGCGSGDPGSSTGSGKISVDELAVTSGAAPGYVDDATCAECHQKIHDSYQHTGMANSFFRPSKEAVIEDFEKNEFIHDASQRRYLMTQRNGEYYFKRFQLDEDGKEINIFKRKIDWILGSGETSRTYLYQTEAGELYQLPIAWYTQEKSWGMAPGYDTAQHSGIARIVNRECMFCHNAYPDVPLKSDHYGVPHIFPKDLPQGIGCQRCHGPGGEHVKAALAKKEEEILTTIVNPAKLDGDLGEHICNSCHLQPLVSISGLRRFGRSDYSFRPGELLDDYMVQVDGVEDGRERSERFEINHHPYRLRQSRCFAQTEGGISCQACHDPHRHVPAEQRVAHYRAACLKCHQSDDCELDEASIDHNNAKHRVDTQDCARCHMPKRRSQDVVHAVMTDHLIQHTSDNRDLLAPLDEHSPVITDVFFLGRDNVPQGVEADIYRTMAVLRAARFRHQGALDHLKNLLDDNKPEAIEPYIDLADAQLKLKKVEDAKKTLDEILRRRPDDRQARQWRGIVLAGLGQMDEAIDHLNQLAEETPDSPEVHYNLGVILSGQERHDDAVRHLREAVKYRPNLFMAWYYLGSAYVKSNRLDDAIDCFRRTLELEPSHTRAYDGIRQAYMDTGQTSKAFRYWRHGQRLATNSVGSDSNLNRFVTERERMKLAPVPKPQLDGLETTVSQQMQASRQAVDQLVVKEKVTVVELAEAYGALGQTYHAYEIAETAATCYQNAHELAPRDFRWLHLAGALYEQAGQLEKAAEQFRAAKPLRPSYAATSIRLGRVLLQLNRLDDARKQFENAKKIQLADPAIYNGLGDLALANKEYEEAIKHYQRTLQMVPAANRIHYSLAMALTFRVSGSANFRFSDLDSQGVGVVEITAVG